MLIDDLNKEDLKDLLVKNWMTHDGAWFLNTFLLFGIDEANKLNKKAIRTLAHFEVERVRKLSEYSDKEVSSYEDIKIFINDAFSVLKGDFMDFKYSFPEKDRFHWEMGRCFAYEGMKKLGVQKEYECGVLYRVSCWLKELGINHKFDPPFKHCLLHSQGQCKGDIILL
jgi:hypothetical protein